MSANPYSKGSTEPDNWLELRNKTPIANRVREEEGGVPTSIVATHADCSFERLIEITCPRADFRKGVDFQVRQDWTTPGWYQSVRSKPDSAFL